MQDIALSFKEPHDLLVEASLNGILSLRHVYCSTQLGVICKLAVGEINSTVYVIGKDIKWHYGPLRDTTSYQSPYGHQAIDHYLLDVIVQPICYPPIKSVSLQFKEERILPCLIPCLYNNLSQVK